MFEYSLFLDDEREPSLRLSASVPNLIVCRSYDEAVQTVLSKGMPTHIYFDHDLGENSKTGFDFAKWLVDLALDNDIQTPIQFSVHSQNPVGAANIKGLLMQFNKYISQ